MTPQKCAQCGAMIDPLALACPYCRFTTPAGVAAHQQQQAQAQWSVQAQHAHFAAARARLGATATQTLVFGILGILLFCTPLGIVGIVQGFRARAMAREAHAPLPGTATAGLVLAILSLFTSIGGIILIDRDVQEDKAVAEQKAKAVEQRLGSKPSASVIDRDTACGVAEAHIWREGDGNMPGYQTKAIECMGKLTLEDDRAEIDLVRVKDSTRSFDDHVCLKRGGKWYVERIGRTACF